MRTLPLNRLPWWLPIILVALAWHGLILASGSVTFHSDEAIVGLMARHINQGQPIPTFFYGQSYMGSLDPLLVSVAFRLFGESVHSIRLTQFALYLGFVATTMILALRLSGTRRAAVMAGLFVALPSALLSLYTTVSLGGYGETLILGNLLLLAGYEIATAHPSSWSRWLALGAIAGLGWWTNNLILVYALPVGLFLLRCLLRRQIIASVIGFFIFSAPWWLYNLTNGWQSIDFLLGGFQRNSTIGPIDSAAGFVLFGLPAVLGVRFPWTPAAWAGAGAVVNALIYIVMLVIAALHRPYTPGAILMWIMLAGIVGIFVVSRFGVDATGRYLLPLTVPLVMLLAFELDRWWQRKQPSWAGAVLFILTTLIGVNVLGTLIAMRTVPPGLTPQFAAETDIPNDYDQQVIDFLREHEQQTGYATYWVAYRLAFLSHESVRLSPQLPYLSSLVFAANDRYPAYTAAADQAARPAYVTANLPALDAIIAQRLNDHAITFARQSIGPFTIFYDLSARIDPETLGLHNLSS